MRCTRAALRRMIPQKGGAIVNNASVLGWRAQAGQSHYAAAKAGVMALTRCAAIAAAGGHGGVYAAATRLACHAHLEERSGVRGWGGSGGGEAKGRGKGVDASLEMNPFLAKVTREQLLSELTQREAFGRAAEPWEVANVIVFLASDYASYMTGEVVAVSSQH